jgi:hypothetical protein
MGFSGEVDDGVNMVVADQVINQAAIANVSVYEGMSRWVWQVFQVFQASSIGKGIQVNQHSLWLCLQYITHEIRANKTGATGDQNVLGHSLIE